MTCDRFSRRLGERQKQILKAVADLEDQTWFNGCGYNYVQPSDTVKILDSLERRKLLDIIGEKEGYSVYRLNGNGKIELGISEELQ